MDFSALTSYLDSLEVIGIPGVDCIIQQGHETIYRHMSGYSDREAGIPVMGSERGFFYSCTKPVVCVAAMQLYERGLFLLTDELGDYMPEFKEMTITRQMPNGERVLEKAKNPIRIVDLFTMTAGFKTYLKAEPLRRVREETNGQMPTRETIRALGGHHLEWEPGTHWYYSTLCHDILGALIEELTGLTFGEYLRQNLFQPLGMTRSSFDTQGIAPQYRRNDETGAVERIGLTNDYILGPAYESGGAGLISCVEDYIKFGSALANGGCGADGTRILSRATIDLMRTNHLSDAVLPTFDWPEMRGYGYGLGVRTLIDPVAAGSNSPLGEFGWFGAAGQYLLVDPERKLSLFYAQHVLENRTGPFKPRQRNSRIRNAFYAGIDD